MRSIDKVMVAFRINPRLLNRLDKKVKEQQRTRQDTLVGLIENYLSSRHRRPPAETPTSPLFEQEQEGK